MLSGSRVCLQWAVWWGCALQLLLGPGASALTMPVRLNIVGHSAARGRPGVQGESGPRAPAKTRPELFQRIMQNDLLRNNTDGWYGLQSSGLYYNLTATVVAGADNRSHIEVRGRELPAARVSPDLAVAVSRRTGWPEVSGGLRYENINFRGLGQRLFCEVSQKGSDLISSGRALPYYSALWSDCNIGEGNADVTALLSADTVALGGAGERSRLSKVGMKFDSRYSIGARSAVALCSEPYVLQVRPLGAAGQRAGYRLIGTKNSVTVKAFGSFPFFGTAAADVGVRAGSAADAAPFAAFTASGSAFLPDVGLGAAAAVPRLLRRRGGPAVPPTPGGEWGDEGEVHVDLSEPSPRIVNLVSVASSWCCGDGCEPAMHHSSCRVRNGGPEIYSGRFSKSGSQASESRSASKIFHGFKLDSYLAAASTPGAVVPGVFAEFGACSRRPAARSKGGPLELYSEYGLSLRVKSLKFQLGIEDNFSREKGDRRVLSLSAFLDGGASDSSS